MIVKQHSMVNLGMQMLENLHQVNEIDLSSHVAIIGAAEKLYNMISSDLQQGYVLTLLGTTKEEILDWLYPHENESQQYAFREKRAPNSALWFLNRPEFQSWSSGSSANLLWCPGNSKYPVPRFRYDDS
jgi:hypothetical protein